MAINMVRLFHDGMQARVKDDGKFSRPFPVTNGVKQGCVLAPTLFSMVISAMLTGAFRDEKVGFELRSRKDGGFFKPQRLRYRRKVMIDFPRDPLFADDCALCAQKLAVTDKSVYLSSTMANIATIDDEISLRIPRASASFGRLKDRVWARRCLAYETKLQVYHAVVLPSLLYACETWTVILIIYSGTSHFICVASGRFCM